MRVLEGLKPERVFYYFEELTRIPHGSGNTDAISAYCMKAAEGLGLECWRDDFNNVTIIKPATAGYEESPAVIIQGHMDMVNEKTADSDHDFMKDPLKLRIVDDWIWATGTTLGGDDGIAVAYVLAILEDNTLQHPRLECLLTTEEEVGMEGAVGYDVSRLTGKYLLNMDSEEEGIFLTSCAGGIRYHLHLPIRRIESEGNVVKLTLTGLMGGHSGAEIDKGRGNADMLLGYVLNRLAENYSYGLISVNGGFKDNAIPREASAEMMIDTAQYEGLSAAVKELEASLKSDFAGADDGLTLTLTAPEEKLAGFMHPADQQKVLFILMQAPNGVQAMSMDIPGLVETSLNLGILETTETEVNMAFAIRSSVENRRDALGAKLASLITYLGGTYDTAGAYPAWEYRRESKLRDLMVETYRDVYGKEPEIQAIHAGLECGLFGKKIPGLDMISFGPDMRDIHTPQERLSIPSVRRTWEYLAEVLRRMK